MGSRSSPSGVQEFLLSDEVLVSVAVVDLFIAEFETFPDEMGVGREVSVTFDIVVDERQTKFIGAVEELFEDRAPADDEHGLLVLQRLESRFRGSIRLDGWDRMGCDDHIAAIRQRLT